MAVRFAMDEILNGEENKYVLRAIMPERFNSASAVKQQDHYYDAGYNSIAKARLTTQ
jgi:hypothetical protein